VVDIIHKMKSTDREEHRADGESGISQANTGSVSSLTDTSKEFRINVRKNRIEAKRLEGRKPTEGTLLKINRNRWGYKKN
jgi:hypothetical protein